VGKKWFCGGGVVSAREEKDKNRKERLQKVFGRKNSRIFSRGIVPPPTWREKSRSASTWVEGERNDLRGRVRTNEQPGKLLKKGGQGAGGAGEIKRGGRHWKIRGHSKLEKRKRQVAERRKVRKGDADSNKVPDFGLMKTVPTERGVAKKSETTEEPNPARGIKERPGPHRSFGKKQKKKEKPRDSSGGHFLADFASKSQKGRLKKKGLGRERLRKGKPANRGSIVFHGFLKGGQGPRAFKKLGADKGWTKASTATTKRNLVTTNCERTC